MLRTQNNTFCVLGGPLVCIYILCVAAAIASAEPGPSTAGAKKLAKMINLHNLSKIIRTLLAKLTHSPRLVRLNLDLNF